MKALFKLVGVIGLACLGSGTLSATQYLVTIQAESGHYLCAENGGGSTLNANRIYAGSWETFVIDDSLGSNDGWSISIKSTDNPKFLCWNNQSAEARPTAPSYAHYNANPTLVVDRDYAGNWETFRFIDPWGAGGPGVLGSGWVNTKILTKADITYVAYVWSFTGGYWYWMHDGPHSSDGTYLRAANGGGGSMDGLGGDQASTGFTALQGWTGTRFAVTVLAVLP